MKFWGSSGKTLLFCKRIRRRKMKQEEGSFLEAGQSVSTNTADALCKLPECGLTDVPAFLPDENTP